MSHIRNPLSLALLAWLFAAEILSVASAQPLCKPQLSVKETHFSRIQSRQRLWTAQIVVDSAQCAQTSGRFQLGMDRIIEYGPDLRFFQSFEWREGGSEIWIVFGYDEAPVSHWIADVAPCGCRNGRR